MISRSSAIIFFSTYLVVSGYGQDLNDIINSNLSLLFRQMESEDYFTWLIINRKRFRELMASYVDSDGKLVLTPYVKNIVNNIK